MACDIGFGQSACTPVVWLGVGPLDVHEEPGAVDRIGHRPRVQSSASPYLSQQRSYNHSPLSARPPKHKHTTAAVAPVRQGTVVS